METNNDMKLGSFVKDSSGCVGEIIGLGKYAGSVRVKFGKDIYLDLDPLKLTISKYSTLQHKKMMESASLLYEALQRLYDFTVGDKDAKYLDQILNECQSALSSATGEGE